MTKMDRLKKSARESFRFRGHKGTPWISVGRGAVSLHCDKCGAYVLCETNPPPNGVEIGGDAVALNCTGRKD
jgi:hypothetical protein